MAGYQIRCFGGGFVALSLLTFKLLKRLNRTSDPIFYQRQMKKTSFKHISMQNQDL